MQTATKYTVTDAELAAVLQEHPDLCDNGMSRGESRNGTPDTLPPLEHVQHSVNYLLTCAHLKRANQNSPSSYVVKHRAEQWPDGRHNLHYVTNGALIAAALILGIDVRPDLSESPLNPLIGVKSPKRARS